MPELSDNERLIDAVFGGDVAEERNKRRKVAEELRGYADWLEDNLDEDTMRCYPLVEDIDKLARSLKERISG